VFVEEYGKPVHPAFRHEADIIRKWRSYKYGDPQPTDLINWCIRFVFDKQELILKSMKLKTIYFKLKDKFPYLYVVHTPQNSEQIIMRIYIKNAAFKRGADINLGSIEDKVREIKNCIIRGVSGIRGAEVIKNGLAHTTIMPNGSTEAKKMYYIETDGTNLSEILENPYLNQYECNTNSIAEIEKVYGIEAARNKILYELQTVINDQAIYEHSSIYADEMSYTGRVTNIQRSGLGKREIDNVLLRASFGGPIQVLQYAAINSQTDHLHGMSASMVMGSIPKFGSVYNDVVIDEQMLLELEPNIDEGIKDL
jgi:DNA-directed RNA polymerase II subunit RPB1